ncbi:MAG: winged helix-turn-helix domain-containing protein [Alphaproteobacteria bacterium]|nr:winged helix-turn-helix domain-containing protein [Alphaproteobacteria bacterium]MBU1515616.1 winged helix-turn-helix domain-containing protein [Alphaproteobacteria bacterium]MBU2096951.1 winged helix-turn-helix domain-containing protein [Alphaproteobacteria bacterium]MBU2149606.1 winged helix-turn-helix domain-containing protein [Alphaproteobacteria bacterium]MBU2305658.1 winged helix-turn-helix domain-containing protein [Alphaproteobacteria bacterium]
MRDTLTPGEARRIALAAQGFGGDRDAPVDRRQLVKLVERLGVIQIDSVNVVSRTHYLPAFSRLGAYPRDLLEDIAWGRKRPLFEYWAHEASLLPLSSQPLFRWRMEDAQAGVGTWKGIAKFLRDRRDFIDRVLDEIATRGPLSASDLEIGHKGEGGWWGWSEAKRAVECLFWAGELTTATRRGTFERVYGLPEKVLPKAIHDAPTPPREEAQRALYRIAARAMGVATSKDLRDYFRMPVDGAKDRIAELVEAGDLLPVKVKGWRETAYLDPTARRPRKIDHTALLSPFDNLIWFRERTERMFGVKIRLEIYTPAEKRTHGYYVLPFLEGDAITARVDLKADRKAGVLIVQASHAEPWASDETPVKLAAELKRMAGWLGLETVRVEKKGDLAGALSRAL